MKGIKHMLNRWLVPEDASDNTEDIELAKEAKHKVAEIRQMRESLFEDREFPITSLLRQPPRTRNARLNK
jgi:hypothetical protein